VELGYLTILGLVAATLTSFSFLPQVLRTWKTRKTHDISLGMYSMFCIGIFLWLVYGFMINDIPLIAANIVTLTLASTVLYFKIRYG
jgi:MtN3 and saliva related transmembrane protein